MSRRIDIELTSARDDGSWTWRAAGAREPKGTVPSAMLPPGAAVGHVLRVEIEGNLDGLDVVAVVPPKAARSGPERLELKPAHADQPLVTSTLELRQLARSAKQLGADFIQVSCPFYFQHTEQDFYEYVAEAADAADIDPLHAEG